VRQAAARGPVAALRLWHQVQLRVLVLQDGPSTVQSVSWVAVPL
jgi:hypothetical protein